MRTSSILLAAAGLAGVYPIARSSSSGSAPSNPSAPSAPSAVRIQENDQVWVPAARFPELSAILSSLGSPAYGILAVSHVDVQGQISGQVTGYSLDGTTVTPIPVPSPVFTVAPSDVVQVFRAGVRIA